MNYQKRDELIGYLFCCKLNAVKALRLLREDGVNSAELENVIKAVDALRDLVEDARL